MKNNFLGGMMRMRETGTTVHGGTGFIGMLQIVFIVLKLCGVIRWSWFLVLLPISISLAIGLILTIIFVILMVFKVLRGRK
jgi:hypothetical protein